jgi:hypothetical protein
MAEEGVNAASRVERGGPWGRRREAAGDRVGGRVKGGQAITPKPGVTYYWAPPKYVVRPERRRLGYRLDCDFVA